jgi:hypothetical protein
VKTLQMNVTPKMAIEWLKMNTANRPLRRTGVDNFHNLFNCGEWKLTHQGIAFGADGILKDGAHRLTFISELPPESVVPMMVTHGMGNDTFGAIDVGIRRTPSDEMGIGQSLSAVATMLAKVYNSNQAHRFTLPYLRRFVDFSQPYHEELRTFCSTSGKTFSSAPMQSAAIVQMARGHNADFVKAVYRSLVLSDIAAMTPTAQALFKQQVSGKAVGSRSIDLFCRGLRVFNSMLPSTSRIQIISATEVTADVRNFLFTQIDAPKLTKKDPRAGGSMVAKPDADSKP